MLRVDLLRTILLVATTAALALLAPAGCGRDDGEPKHEPVRAIRAFLVEEGSPGRVIQFSGVVEPADTATLAFSVGGTVESIDVDLGDTVETNEMLAGLDQERYRLAVEARRGELDQALEILRERERSFERHRVLFGQDEISEAEFDRIRSQYEAARADVEVARPRLSLAERDLKDTRLRAPYRGVIAKRMAEQHEEVAAGQPIFELQVERRAEVAVMMPETQVFAIRVGDPVAVDIPALGLTQAPGLVVEIGRSSVGANAFPVTIALEGEEDVWAGMTVEVAFTFETRRDGFLVPAAAVLAEGPGQSAVFVVDEQTSAVRRARVEIGTIHPDRIEVLGGIEAGDRIVSAGVEFLHDGQQVRLHPSDRPGDLR